LGVEEKVTTNQALIENGVHFGSLPAHEGTFTLFVKVIDPKLSVDLGVFSEASVNRSPVRENKILYENNDKLDIKLKQEKNIVPVYNANTSVSINLLRSSKSNPAAGRCNVDLYINNYDQEYTFLPFSSSIKSFVTNAKAERDTGKIESKMELDFLTSNSTKNEEILIEIEWKKSVSFCVLATCTDFVTGRTEISHAILYVVKSMNTIKLLSRGTRPGKIISWNIETLRFQIESYDNDRLKGV